MKLLSFLALAMLALSAASSWAAGPPERQVAITVDDLPAGAADRMSGATIDEMTAKLVGTLREQKVPVVGFVNAGKLFKWAKQTPASRHCRSGSITASSWAITLTAMLRSTGRIERLGGGCHRGRAHSEAAAR